MRIQTSQKAELFGRTPKIAFMGVFAVFVWAFVLSLSFSPRTDAATSSTVNFQARLESSAGNIAANGTYNVEFKLYNAATSTYTDDQGACTMYNGSYHVSDPACLWTEDYLVSASSGVQVVNGYLTANLGSITAFPSNMNWNQQLWLTMRIGSTGSSPTWDTEMSPRLLLTATPYSFQAGQLSATNSGYVGTLSFASTLTGADSIIIPNTGGAGGTVCLQSSGTCGFLTGSGTGVQLQGSSPGSVQTGNFNVSGTGIAGVLQAGTFDTPTSETLSLGSTNANAITIGNSTNNIATTINGTVIIKPTPSHDSITTFQVQNASGATILSADTTANTLNLSGNLNLNQLAAPTPAPTVAVGSAGSLTGTYCYAISFVTASGQTDYGPDSSSVSPSSQEVNLTAIPTGPSNLVTARDIYRDDCYGDYSSLVGTISNNTATTFTDNNTSPVAVGSDINRTAQFQINGNTILIADTTNSANTGLGVGALQGNTTGIDNNAIGTNALYSNTAGYFNNALGYMTLYGNTTGYDNNAIGESALYSNTTGYDNNAIGTEALYSNTTGYDNNAIGTEALYSNTTGTGNNALGYGALYSSYGTDNNAIGNQALYNNDSWNNNALGDNALYSDTSGGSNTAIGSQALQSTTTGAGNTAIGFKALSYSNTTGSYNSALGYYAGFQDSGGNFGTGAVLQNATAIGAYAQVQASNSIVLGSVDTATKVGIGTTIPLNTFSVSPMIYNTGTACSVASSGSSTCSGTSTVYLYGSSTVWTASMVGDELIFADGQESIISAVTSNTAITLAVAVNEASGSYYRIHVIGLQVTNAGNTYVQNTSTTGFQLQNSTGSALLTGDTTNMRLGVDVTYEAMSSPTISAHSTSSSGGTLAYSTTYYYKITAVDAAGGETAPSAQVSQATSSSPATNTYTITLTWAPITGAAGYHIYRSTTSGTFTSVGYYSTLGTVSGSNLTFTDTNATLNNTTASPPATTNAYASTNVSNNNLQLSVGGNGTPTGQLYVSGTVPTSAVGSVSTGTKPESVYVSGRYAYVTNYSSNTLGIYDVSNPANPVSVGSVSTGTHPAFVYVSGRYAYVSNSNSSTLGIYDVSNPASPVAVGSVSTGITPESVYVQGRYAYVAGYGTNTLGIYDVSNPANPVAVGSVSTGASSNPISVYVQGRYAYVANLNGGTLGIYDVSNPANPVAVGSVYAGSLPYSVYVSGRYAYVTNYSSNTLGIYDVSNPANPVAVGSVSTGASSNPVSVYVQGRYAYVTTLSGNTLGIYDVSNPANPVAVGSVYAGFWPYSVYVQGRYAYVANSGSNTLSIFDLGGAYVQQLQAGGTETGTLQVDTNAQIFGDENIQGGLSVGSSIQDAGNLAVAGATNLGSMVTITGGPASTPGAPTVTPTGGSSTSYSYKIAAINGSGQTTAASTAGSTSTGAATLTSSAYNTITWTAVTGAYGYNIYRTASGGTPSSLGMIGTTTGTSFVDIGYAANTSATAPSSNSITTAFQVQNAAGTSLLAADTTNMQVIIGNTTNGVAISTSGGITAYGTARHTNKIILTPEYAGAVLDNGGASSDIGTMTAGYDSTQKENYYQWTTAQSTNQTYDIVIQIPIPSNFSSALPFATNDPLTVDINTSDTTNGTVVGTLLDTSGTAVTNWNTCSLTPTVTGWITSGAGATYGATCNITTGTWTAGGVATLRLHIQAPPSGTTKVGDIVLTYISAY